MQQIMSAISEIKTQLERLNSLQSEYLSLEEAAKFLKMSKSTLYKHTHRRTVPFYQPHGKLIVFKKSELQDWVEGKQTNNLKTSSHEPK